MKEEKKKSKKKILLYYLILGICLLVIAAVTVTVIFAVNRSGKNKLTADGGTQQQPSEQNPGNSGGSTVNPPDDEEPQDTSSAYEFCLPVDNAEVTTKYEFYANETIHQYRDHMGMDFKGNAGDNVMAAIDGTVVEVGRDNVYYGGYVIISHANNIQTVYKFIDPAAELKVGDKVNRGDVIGCIAEACGIEKYQGAHLHFEVKENDKNTDPANHLNGIEK